MPNDLVAAKIIADLRTRLLDLRNGNKLLSYKHSERAKTHVRVVDEMPDFLHDCLTNNKSLSFRPLPEPENELPDEQTDDFLMALDEARRLDKTWAALLNEEEDIVSDRALKIDRQIRDRVRSKLGLPTARGGKLVSIADWARLNGIEPSFDLPTPTVGKGHDKHTDSEIQTLLLPDELQGKLAGVIDHARTAQQEIGVNVLHIAIGFLEWYETNTTEKSMLAPLLLYPAEIERKPMRGKGQYRYFLRGEQDPVINITLRQRLADDYNLIVPELCEDDTAETYLAKMAAVVSEFPRWRVRRFATLGLFSFSRLVMYNDLDPARWGGDDGLPNAGTLKELFGRKEVGSSDAEKYDIEDPEIEAEVPLLIRDADSSQHQAIIDVMRGKNLVIKGPPGTGKSQTIANIIAAALARRKSVLFIAEKAAALDVVKKRLDDAGIGEFCFELHSTKARKQDILASLERRLNLPAHHCVNSAEAALSELRSLREQLTRHAETMNRPFGAVEIRDRGQWRQATIHDILWAEQRTRAITPRFLGLERVCLSNAAETTRFDSERRQARLATIERLVSEFIEAYGSVGHHPWAFVSRPDVQALDVSEIADAASKASAKLMTLYRCITDAGKVLGATRLPTALSEMGGVAKFIVALPAPAPGAPDYLIKIALKSEEAVTELEGLLSTVSDLRGRIGERAALLTNPAIAIAVSGDDLGVIVNQARRAGLADNTLAEIASKAARSRRDLAGLNKTVALARQFLNLLGCRELPTSPRVLRRALDAAELLASAERQALLSRIPSVIDEAVTPILNKAKSKIEILRDRDAVLREQFVVDIGVPAVELRRYAGILKSTGFIGRFGSEYTITRKTCVAMLKGDAEHDNPTVARMLIELADHLEARQSLETDATLRTICAHRFFGLDTNISALLAANKLAVQVRSEFAGMTEPERTIRRLLMEADIEVIDAINAFFSDPRLEELRRAIAEMDDPDIDIAELSERLQVVGTVADTIYAAFVGIGFRENVTPNRAFGLADIVNRIHQLEALLANGPGAQLIGQEAWKGRDTDLTPIRATIDFVEDLKKYGVPETIVEVLASDNRAISASIESIRAAGRHLEAATSAAVLAVKTIVERIVTTATAESEFCRLSSCESIDDLARRFNRAAENTRELMRWVTLRRGILDAREDGLSPLLDAYDEAGEEYLDLKLSYGRLLYRSLARSVMEAHPELSQAAALSLDDIRTRFRTLDQRIMEMRLQSLVAGLSSVRIPQGIQSPRKGECTEATLLRNEIAKKKKHIPVRDLIERASGAISAMKPCTMMSPASVAQYLKPGQSFDIVIIDEASQMRPEEAISALARASQAVVVGDPQQLPPSSFFDRQDGDGHDDEDEEFEKMVAESILDVARTVFQPTRELLWHYRSRHGSLIAFSNRHFYDERLIVFPSPQEDHPDYGVRMVTVIGQYRASVNVPEVQAVTRAAVEFMAEHPGKSLGIVALNQPQRDLILAEMDRLFVRDTVAERYRARWHVTLEPFFVKNLENVQGDERDVIFISTVYGPDEKGNLMHRFGPINGAAGDRRLNVLFSRAKHGVTVFTSMRPDQIRSEASTARGTRLLKDYLQYAATGRLDHGHVPYKECDSDFECFVKQALEAKGYEVVAQVGVSGFWIDLGIKHPEWPWGFLLGIECDGAAYHSSLSARDRDRLRQQILEGLGWTIYRVWSTDWFRDQHRELAKMVSFIEQTLADSLAQQRDAEALMADRAKTEVEKVEDDVEPEAPWKDATEEEDSKDTSGKEDADGAAEEPVADVPDTAELQSITNPILGSYREADFVDLGLRLDRERFFDECYEPTLIQLIERTITVEGPIRDDVLTRRVASAHGFQKAGGRIRGHVSSLASPLYKSTKEEGGRFFWPTGFEPDEWRTFRRPAGEPDRSFDEIAIQELSVLALIVRQRRLIPGDDPLVAMSRIAGFQRLRGASRPRLELAYRTATIAKHRTESE